MHRWKICIGKEIKRLYAIVRSNNCHTLENPWKPGFTKRLQPNNPAACGRSPASPSRVYFSSPPRVAFQHTYNSWPFCTVFFQRQDALWAPCFWLVKKHVFVSCPHIASWIRLLYFSRFSCQFSFSYSFSPSSSPSPCFSLSPHPPAPKNSDHVFNPYVAEKH